MIGIDVSGWDGEPFDQDTEPAYQDASFVIVKATEAEWFTNKSFDYAIERASRDGKLLGTYHYAGGMIPENEAEFYWNKVKKYNGIAIPFLDWEAGSNIAWGDTEWCRRFINRYHDLSGVWPGIYVQASAVWQCANCCDVSPLWIAGYPYPNNGSWNIPNFIYSTSPWPKYTIWQFTTGSGVDKDVSYISPEEWMELAKGGIEMVTDDDIARIAEAVWNLGINGVMARDRLYGLDSIQVPMIKDQVWDMDLNGVKARDRLIGLDSIQVPAVIASVGAIVDILRADSNASPDAIANAVANAVKNTLEKISLEVKVD